MFIPLGDITRFRRIRKIRTAGRKPSAATIYPNVINILAASSGEVLTSSLQLGLQAGDTRRGVGSRCVPQLAVPVQQLLCPFDLVQAARVTHMLVMKPV
jgi:hypothetical protein